MQVAFREMDTDGSGEVEFEEFEAWWSASQQAVGTALTQSLFGVIRKRKTKRGKQNLHKLQYQ